MGVVRYMGVRCSINGWHGHAAILLFVAIMLAKYTIRSLRSSECSVVVEITVDTYHAKRSYEYLPAFAVDGRLLEPWKALHW
jgi:hypothetical protein